MFLSDSFYNAASAVLLLYLVYVHIAQSPRMGRIGLVLTVAGALLPLLDFAIFFVRSVDRIAFLTQTHLLGGLPLGMGAITAIAGLTLFVVNQKTAVRVWVLMSTGYLLHLGLALLTPSGVPLLDPYWQQRFALPIFRSGHPLLLAILALVLVGLEVAGRWRTWWLRGAVVLISLYIAVGTVQFAVISVRAQPLAGKTGKLFVEPSNGWLSRWLVTVVREDEYLTLQYGLDLGPLTGGETIERWNDETMLMSMLGDPITRNFYFNVFRHPVVHTSTTGGKTTLVMQELEDQEPPIPGRTFYLELDHEVGGRLYRVARFD